MAAKAYPGTIELNGKKYNIRGPLVKGRVDEYVEGMPTTTEQLRTARRYLQVGAVTTIKGLLVSRDDDNSLQSCWDSTLETRFADQITLPNIWSYLTAITAVGDDVNAKKFVGPVNTFDGVTNNKPSALIAVKDNTDLSVQTFWFNPATQDYASSQTIAGDAVNAVSVHDMVSHGPYVFLVFRCGTGDNTRLLYRTTNPNSFLMTNPLVPDPGNFPHYTAGTGDATLLCSVGNKLFLLAWRSNTGDIYVHYSTDNGVTWTTAASTMVNSSYAPTSAVAYTDEDGIECLHVGTAEGVYRYDSTGDNPVLILNLKQQASQFNCQGMAVWGQTGALYIPLDIYPQGQVYEYSIQNGVRYLRPVGLNLGAGLPSYRQAQVVQLVPQGQWLFAMTRTSTACFVYAFDGEGWHHIFNSTYSDFSSTGWSSDTTAKAHSIAFVALTALSQGPSLQIAYWNVTAGGVKSIKVAEMHNALENPLAVSSTWSQEGFIDLPYFSGGSSEVKTLALQCRVDADDMSAANDGQCILVTYGINGAARTTTTLGYFLSGTKKLPIASGAGVEVNTIGFRLKLLAPGANHPKLYAFTAEFMKQPTARHTFQFLVDVKATAITQARTEEEVYDELEALESVATQITFSAPGVTQKYTKLASTTPTFRWAFPDQTWDNPLEVHHGEGLVAVSLVELVT